MGIKRFKFNQYICLKPEYTQEGSWGYIVNGYDYVDGELYLYSGNANISHHISTLKEHYQKHILKMITEGETYSNYIGD